MTVLEGLPLSFEPREATSLSGNVFKQRARWSGKALGSTTASIRRLPSDRNTHHQGKINT